MLLHYCIWLNKEKYSSDASWIIFFFQRMKLMFFHQPTDGLEGLFWRKKEGEEM